MDVFQKCRNYQLAEVARDAGIYPFFRALESRQDPVVMVGGREVAPRTQDYRRVVDRQDVDIDRPGHRSAVVVDDGDLEAVGTESVGIGGVGPITGRVDGDGAVGSLLFD